MGYTIADDIEFDGVVRLGLAPSRIHLMAGPTPTAPPSAGHLPLRGEAGRGFRCLFANLKILWVEMSFTIKQAIHYRIYTGRIQDAYRMSTGYPEPQWSLPEASLRHPEGSSKKEETMTRARLHPLLEELHGTMYDVIFKKSPSGNLIITRRPNMSKVKWSKAQKAHRERFKQATEYAKAAMADPKVRAVYEAMGASEHKRPYAMALSDYFNGNDLLSKE